MGIPSLLGSDLGKQQTASTAEGNGNAMHSDLEAAENIGARDYFRGRQDGKLNLNGIEFVRLKRGEARVARGGENGTDSDKRVERVWGIRSPDAAAETPGDMQCDKGATAIARLGRRCGLRRTLVEQEVTDGATRDSEQALPFLRGNRGRSKLRFHAVRAKAGRRQYPATFCGVPECAGACAAASHGRPPGSRI